MIFLIITKIVKLLLTKDMFQMENTLKIPFSEINLIRISCSKCQTSIEIPLERLEHTSTTCPVCNHIWRRPDIDQSLINFTNSIRHLQKIKDFKIQLILKSCQNH